MSIGDNETVFRIKIATMRHQSGVAYAPGRVLKANMTQCQFTNNIIRQDKEPYPSSQSTPSISPSSTTAFSRSS